MPFALWNSPLVYKRLHLGGARFHIGLRSYTLIGEFEMRRWTWTLGLLLVTGSAAATHAQPPGGQRPNGPGGGGQGGGGGRPGGPGAGARTSPIVEALDADGDGVISAEELKNATAALMSLDKDGNGKLTEEEFRPAGRGPGGPGPAGRGLEGPGGPPSTPNPDRMFEHAMGFDMDKDGKLSSSELKRFITDFVSMHGNAEGRGGPGGPGGPGPGGRPSEGGERSERPRRPQ